MGLEALGFLGLAAGIANTAVNASMTSEMNEKQFKQQKDLMRYQDELNANRWQQQFNQIAGYNEPANQLQRLEKAGINPLFDSQFGGQTAASIQANTSLPGYSPSVPQVDLISGFSKLADSLFTAENLKLEDRKVKAMEEKTGSDIKNDTSQTASEIAVNAQRIENMISEKNKTEEEIHQIKEDVVALKESVKQNWQKIRLAQEQNAQSWKKLGIEQYTSKWQEQVARMNNSIGWYDANTRRQNVDIAQESLNFAKSKFDKEYDFQFKKFSSELRQGKIDAFVKVLDQTSTKFFGKKFLSPALVSDATALMSAFVNSLDNMDQKDFLRIAPKASYMMNYLNSLAPSFGGSGKLGERVSNYVEPLDSSDSW